LVLKTKKKGADRFYEMAGAEFNSVSQCTSLLHATGKTEMVEGYSATLRGHAPCTHSCWANNNALQTKRHEAQGGAR